MKEELKAAIALVVANKEEEGVMDGLKDVVPTFGFNEAKAVIESTEEGKKYVDSVADSRTTKGIHTALEKFKSEKLPDILAETISSKKEEWMKEKGLSLSPEEKRIKELEERQAKFESEQKRKDVLLKATQEVGKRKLPTEFINFVIGQDEESTVLNIESIENIFKEAVENKVKTAVDSKFKELGGIPEAGAAGTVGNTKLTAAKVQALKEKAASTNRREDILAFSKAKRELLAQEQG